MSENTGDITEVIGAIPYRMALAGGWIDQPFVSQHNPSPPGAMVVVSLEPVFHFMDRSGMATSTRKVALQLWKGILPNREPTELVRELYHAENYGKPAPSGSQDMAGIIYPGISRLDYDFNVEGGYFPAYVENCNDPSTIAWLENIIHILPIYPRSDGYDPLLIKNLVPVWVHRLGQTGHDCYRAILSKDAHALGAAMNETMRCWEVILPANFQHPTLKVDLVGLLKYYQKHYFGAAYSSCGGGYLYVVSGEPVPGAFHGKIRSAQNQNA
jgi:hypothetical protein